MGFLHLPLEVQDAIIKKLDFPDLTRLRMTCRYMRDLPTFDIRRQALLHFESRWLFLSAESPRKYQRSTAFKAPCYTCLLLRDCNDFEEIRENEPRMLARLSSKWRRPSLPNICQPNASRQCVDCLINELQSQPEITRSRLIETEERCIVVCKGCKKAKLLSQGLNRSICYRQEMAAVCNDCFAEEKAKWEQHRVKINEMKYLLERRLYLMDRIDQSGYTGKKVWSEARANLREPLPDLLRDPEFKFLD